MKNVLKKHACRKLSLFSLILILIVPLVLGGCSKKDIQERYIKKALIFASLGKYSKAEALMKKGIDKYPDSLPLHYNLGIIYSQQRKFDKALIEFDKTLNLDPEHSPTFLALARIKYTEGEFDAAIEKVDKALQIDPTYVDAITFRGVINQTQKKYDTAISDYQRLVEIQPKKPQGYLNLARIYLSMRNFEKTTEYCNKVLNDIDPQNSEALLMLSLILEHQDKIDEAISLIRNTFEKVPNNVGLVNRLADLYYKSGDLDNAFEFAQKALALEPRSSTARYVKGSVHFTRQEYDKAAVEFENFNNPPPAYKDVFYKLALCYLELDKPQQGINELKKMIDQYPDYAPAYFTLAFTYLREGWADEAIKLCERGLELNPNNIKGLEIMAKGYIATKNFDAAEHLYEKLVTLRPQNVADILSLASLKINKGEIDECLSLCQRVLEINDKSINAHNIIGFCYIRLGKIDEAIKEFSSVIDLDPLNVIGHMNLAKIYTSTQRFEEAEQELLTVIKLQPDYEEAYLELGHLYFIQQKYDDAIKAYTKILENDPQNISVNIAVANSYFAQDKYDEALEILDPLRKNPKFDDNLQLHSFLASLFMKMNQTAEAEEEYKKVLNINPRFRPAYDLGLIYTDQGKSEESIEIYKQALKLNPDLNEMLLYLAVAQQQSNQFKESLDSINKLISMQPQNYYLHFIKYNILVSYGEYDQAQKTLDEIPNVSDELREEYAKIAKLCQTNQFTGQKFTLLLNTMKIYQSRGWNDQAIEIAEQAKDLLPESNLPLSFIAEIKMLDKDYNKAKEYLNKILENNPNSLLATTKLSRVYSMEGEKEKAIDFLNRAIKIEPNNPSFYIDLGMLYEASNKKYKAIEAYKSAVEIDNESFHALNNIAWLIADTKGDIQLAKKYAEQAVNLAPQNGAITDTYGWILYQSGEYESARNYLETAFKALPNNAYVAYHLGKTYLALNDRENAYIVLKKALELSSDFTHAEETKDLLKNLE
jgi:tetratricopeptide (TPR) repeat protein